jgi:hypothetical protein
MLTVQTLRRIEVWSNLACAGGTRRAVIPDAQSCVATVALDGDSRLLLTLPLTSPAAAELQERRVIHLDQDDTTFDEWRILELHHDDQAGTIDVTAVPVEQELARSVMRQVDGLGVVRHNIDVVALTPQQILSTFVIPALAADGFTWVGIGTIEPTAPVDLTMAWDTALSVVRRLAELTGTEFQLRRNGTMGYLIDLVSAIGASAPVADVRARKNLTQLDIRRATDAMATRIYPRGAEEDGVHATMGRAVWKVTAVAGNVVTLADPAGGPGPIEFDGQLLGRYLRKVDGTFTQIAGSSEAAQTVTVTSAAGIAVGDRVRICLDNIGTELTYLESPADLATYGLIPGVLDVPDVPDVVNVISNPAMRDWPFGATPADWLAIGDPVAQKETVQTQIGGASIKVTANSDGDGVETVRQRIETSAANPYVSGYVKVYVQTGQVRVELVAWSQAKGETVYPTGANLATSSGTGAWLDLGVSGIDFQAIGATHAKIRIVQHGPTPAVFYVDAGQITNSASQQPFIEGSGGTRLWQAANARLRAQGGPAVSYSAALVDLARLDGATWGQDAALVLGGTVRVTQPTLGVALTTRVVGIQRDYLVPGNTTITLSTKPEDLTGTFSRGRRGVKPGARGITAPPDARAFAAIDETGVIRRGTTGLGWGVSRADRLFLRSTSFNDTAVENALVTLNAATIVNTSLPGHTLAVIRRSDHTVVSVTRYDTYGDAAQRTALANALNALANDVFVILVSYDAIGWSATLDAAYRRCGGSRAVLQMVGDGGSGRFRHAFLGAPEIGEARGAEVVQSTDVGQYQARIDTLLLDGIAQAWKDDAYAAGGAGRSYAGLNDAGRVISGVEDSADIGGTRADIVRGTIGSTPGNLIINGGGQQGTIGSQATGWTFIQGAPVVPATDAAKIGDRSLKITHSGQLSSQNRQQPSVISGRVYRLSGWIKTTAIEAGTNRGAFLDVFAPSVTLTPIERVGDPFSTNDQLDVGVAANGAARDWTYVQSVFRAETTGTFDLFLTLVTGPAGGTAWFDGVELLELPPAVTDGAVRGAQALVQGVPVGGVWPYVVSKNKNGLGQANSGEVCWGLTAAGVTGTFTHPDGTEFTVSAQAETATNFEVVGSGEIGTAYLMFVGSDKSRFGALDTVSLGNPVPDRFKEFLAVRYTAGVWQYNTNVGWATFTPNEHDCIVGLISRPDTSTAGIATLQRYAHLTMTDAAEKAGGGRAVVALSPDSRLVTGVDESADISGIRAGLVSRQAHGVFLETFEQVPSWPNLSGNPTIMLLPQEGQAGGNSLRISGEAYLAFPHNIPFDPSKLYRVRVRLRQVTAPTSGGVAVYCGVMGIAADGTTKVNAFGTNDIWSQHYVAAYGEFPTAGAGWVVYTGWIKGWAAQGYNGGGTSPVAPGALHQNARYFRPLVIVNYPSGNGTTDVDYIAVDVLDEEAQRRTYSALDSNARLTLTGLSGEALAQLLSTAQQLAPNGNFEQGFAYWHPTNDGTLILDTSTKFGGTQSLRVPFYTGFNNDLYACIDGRNLRRSYDATQDLLVRVTPGDVLRLKGAAKVSSTDCVAGMGVRYWDVNRGHLGWSFVLPWSDTGWTQKEAYWVVPNGCYYVTPWISARGNANPSGKFAWFDELRWDRIDRRAFLAIDGSGNLNPTVTQSDGVAQRLIAKGHVAGHARHGQPVTFPVNFQNPPMVLLRGGILYEPRAKWGPTGNGSEGQAPNSGLPQYEDLAALNLSPSGFTLRARLRQKGSLAQKSNTFPAGTLTGEGQTLSVTVTQAPAADDTYTVSYTVSLEANGAEIQQVSARCTVAVDTVVAGIPTMRSSKSYSVQGFGVAQQTWLQESQTITVSGLQSTDAIRVRIALLTGDGPVLSIDPDAVTYWTSTGDIFASKTPDLEDEIYWEAMAVS